MEVKILSTSTLKPSPPSTSNTHIPLTIFDKISYDGHICVMFAFLPPMPSNTEMKGGLAKALAYFPHLAGRFSVNEQGKSAGIVLNDAGIRLIETDVNTTLAQRLPMEPSPELSRLHPPTAGVEELLQIQLNRFSCGGLLIGTACHHRVADGKAVNSFFLAWAKLVRGLDVDPLPYHDRRAISVPRNPPRCEFNHKDLEFGGDHPFKNPKCSSSIDTVVVPFSADFLKRLKAHVDGRGPGHVYSTFECLLAHLWKKITLVRGLEEDELTQVRVAVDGRPRMKPAVPMEYFGNLVLSAYPRLKVRDLLGGSYAFVAKAIRDAVANIDDSYIRSFIDFGELSKAGGGRVEMEHPWMKTSSLFPFMEVNSWLRFQFHELNFGTGHPCAFVMPGLPTEGVLIFTPSCREKDGVDLFITLFSEHVEHFKKICHSLD